MEPNKYGLELRPLAGLVASELSALAGLRVSDQQEVFGGSFTESLEAWDANSGPHLLGYALFHQDQPVGMVLFKRPPLSPGWVPQDAASIHGLKIALPWQGRGWGHEALALSVGALRRDWPDVRVLWLAVDAENHAAIAVYTRFGMLDSGPIFQGRVGLEHRLHIGLPN